jgi:hypothetical protein
MLSAPALVAKNTNAPAAINNAETEYRRGAVRLTIVPPECFALKGTPAETGAPHYLAA